MAYDVALVEVYKGNAVHTFEHVHDLKQAAAPGVGQINLRDVAGDDALGVESHAGDKHLHLLRSRVLRLIEDDERIVERTAAHEGNGRNLNHVLFQMAVNLFAIHQIVDIVFTPPHTRI